MADHTTALLKDSTNTKQTEENERHKHLSVLFTGQCMRTVKPLQLNWHWPVHFARVWEPNSRAETNHCHVSKLQWPPWVLLWLPYCNLLKAFSQPLRKCCCLRWNMIYLSECMFIFCFLQLLKCFRFNCVSDFIQALEMADKSLSLNLDNIVFICDLLL